MISHPLKGNQLGGEEVDGEISANSPSSPHGVDIHSLGDIQNELDVGIVVVICAAGNLDVVVCHSDVICVGLQILWCGHDGEVNGSLVAERLVGPFSN